MLVTRGRDRRRVAFGRDVDAHPDKGQSVVSTHLEAVVSDRIRWKWSQMNGMSVESPNTLS